MGFSIKNSMEHKTEPKKYSERRNRNEEGENI